MAHKTLTLNCECCYCLLLVSSFGEAVQIVALVSYSELIGVHGTQCGLLLSWHICYKEFRELFCIAWLYQVLPSSQPHTMWPFSSHLWPFSFRPFVCEPQRWFCVKIPVDQQFVMHKDLQQPCHVQNAFLPDSDAWFKLQQVSCSLHATVLSCI